MENPDNGIKVKDTSSPVKMTTPVIEAESKRRFPWAWAFVGLALAVLVVASLYRVG